jgi:4-hydroxybenzoate polyprenyltransferase
VSVEAARGGLLAKTPLFLGAVRFQETIFALPFAFSGMVLAADGLPEARDFVWITVAMVGARTLGMSANRVIDRHIDAGNPRTAMRHLPQGLLGAKDMYALCGVSALVFFVAASQLNALALALAPVAAAYLIAYPYAKRVTWAGSFMLGWALAIAPVGAWIGVTGSIEWEAGLLAAAVAFWAASFDILYHAEDRDYYVRRGLHSVSQRFGIPAAFRMSGVLDVIAVGCLVAFGVVMGLALPYYVGCVVVSVLLVYRRRMVSPDDLSRMGAAFMRINAYVSTTVLVAVTISLAVA